MKIKPVAVFLFIAGTILLGIGAAILLAPEAFHRANGIVLAGNASLMSEVRAPGGLLLACGLVILAGSFLFTLRHQSVALATLVYGTYGLSRMLSMSLDGMPSKGIVGATALELAIAAIGVLILTREAMPVKSDSPNNAAPTPATAAH